MNPVTPTSAMSQGGTFVRPGAMAWGQGDSGVQDPATPAAEQAFRGGPGQEFPVDVTFPAKAGQTKSTPGSRRMPSPSISGLAAGALEQSRC
jgi:hypothetical protein